jgi:uncharacterized membrane protein HdeD (DUF308 family)
MFDQSLNHTWRPLRPRVRLGKPWTDGPLAQIWWIVLVRAFVAMACGVLAIGWPHHALIVLVRALGVFALLEGTLGLVLSAMRGKSQVRLWTALGAATSLAAAAAALTQPRWLAAILVMAAGAWLVVRGIIVSCESLTDRRERRQEEGLDARVITGEELCLLVDGVTSGIFGLAMFTAPHLGAFGLVLGLGAWALLHGALLVGYALELRDAPPLPET